MPNGSVALVLHGENADERSFSAEWARRNPQVVNEREALRLACAYSDGATATAERIASALFTDRYSRAWMDFVRLHEPKYENVRNFLEGDCNVAPVIAARVALRLTRWQVIS